MDSLFAFAVCAIVVTVVCGQSTENDWRMYKIKFKKNYYISADGGKQDRIHKEIFFQRNDQIKQHNSNQLAHYRRELTQFSDMLPNEFQRFLGVNPAAIPNSRLKSAVSYRPEGADITDPDIPSRLDYRYDPCLPEVKTQFKCASSWAFSAITPVEFAYCRKNNNISVALSEQQLIDCDRGGFDMGCYGGWPMKALEYMQNGIAEGSQYPYKKTGGQCKYVDSMKAASVALSNYIDSGTIVDMQYALTKLGPISAVLAVTDSLADYADGVYDETECDGKVVNHAVVIVGWGNLNGLDYWIVRNSWGTGWGKRGYFLIQRGVNKCGIESYPVYVKIA